MDCKEAEKLIQPYVQGNMPETEPSFVHLIFLQIQEEHLSRALRFAGTTGKGFLKSQENPGILHLNIFRMSMYPLLQKYRMSQ